MPKFNGLKFAGSAVTTVTGLIALILSNSKLTLIINAVVAALVVAAVLLIVYGYQKLVLHKHIGMARVAMVVTLITGGLVVYVVLRPTSVVHEWHWFTHLTSLRGWITVAVLIVGYYVAWFSYADRQPRQRRQGNQQRRVPRTHSLI